MQKLVSSNVPEPIQIAAILGLPRPRSYDVMGLVEALEAGIPTESAAHAARTIDPTGTRVQAHDLLPQPVLDRARQSNQPLSSQDSDTLWQIARVFLEARRIYHNSEDALNFLLRRHALFDGRTPLDLASKSAAGAEAVIELLWRAEAGVAV